MILYEMTIKYESLSKHRNDRDALNSTMDKRKMSEIIKDVNQTLGKECGLDGNLSVVIFEGKSGTFNMVIACQLEKVSLQECKKWIVDFFSKNYSVKNVKIEKISEISVKDFIKNIDKAEGRGYGYMCSVYRELGCTYFDNTQFKVKEKIYETQKLSYSKAIELAKGIMADKSLYEEIERIYSGVNAKKYYGNPIHYVIKAGTMAAAQDIIKILIGCLNANSRILGNRVNYIDRIKEGCYSEEDFTNLFKLGEGTAVSIDMSGSDEDHGVYASAYHDAIDFITEVIEETQLYTLCFFVQLSENPGFSKGLIAAVQDKIHLIEVSEGRGDKREALKYLEMLVEQSEYEAKRDELENVLSEKRSTYSASEVHSAYNMWFGGWLKNSLYPSYKDSTKVRIENDKKNSKPYDELQKMVGLNDIKKTVDQIISTNKIRVYRSKLGMDNFDVARHMIFTGNPGSAKTTVARLISEILKNEGAIESGNFIECGRADLVAKYVGWTAKEVQRKFREARGGILFIDEAYSLVDESKSFGAEAINTIVQEMENNRDKVIVIFAGYPDKMERFLNENEGLRSRIAFHLDFPDYNAEEMLQILELMATEKGYLLDGETKQKCLNTFKNVCKIPEFGNGRFVRNLLEQAIMKQSERVMSEMNGKKITRKKLQTLVVDDFSVNVEKTYKKSGRILGFHQL